MADKALQGSVAQVPRQQSASARRAPEGEERDEYAENSYDLDDDEL